MSLPQFFVEGQILADEAPGSFPLRLSRDDAKHARVLRLAAGEHIAVVDAAQDYFECEIVSFEGDVPLVRISRHADARDAGPRVVLVQGLAKGDKMDLVIRHATELGVAEFIPLACERSVVRLDAKKAAARAARWRSIAKSAAMQSGQLHVPQVGEPAPIAAVCDRLSEATAVLVCWEEAPSTARLSDALGDALAGSCTRACDAEIAVVVGPEGGLAQAEVDVLLACNPRSSLVSLGPSILRTETAGIVAPALVLYELGGLGAGERA